MRKVVLVRWSSNYLNFFHWVYWQHIAFFFFFSSVCSTAALEQTANRTWAWERRCVQALTQFLEHLSQNQKFYNVKSRQSAHMNSKKYIQVYTDWKSRPHNQKMSCPSCHVSSARKHFSSFLLELSYISW